MLCSTVSGWGWEKETVELLWMLTKQPETDRARSIIDALEPANALLILDNIESLPREQQNQLFEFLSQLPSGC